LLIVSELLWKIGFLPGKNQKFCCMTGNIWNLQEVVRIYTPFLRPFSPKRFCLDADISKSHADALEMPMRLLIIF